MGILKTGEKTSIVGIRPAVIITERKEHIETLNQFLKQKYETITLSGNDPETHKNSKWKLLKEGNYQVLITTGQFLGEGTDLQNANCLFLAYPFSFKGKLIQYIGRVQRSEIAPVIYDYNDHKINYLHRLFLKRNSFYRQWVKKATLFDDITENKRSDRNFTEIRETIKLSFDQLAFRYGSLAFNYVEKDTGEQLEYEIEHENIRPEFEVLKPYFAKKLKLKNINISIYAEFQNNVLISQAARSDDLECINNELIESLKFKFIAQSSEENTGLSPLKGALVGIDRLKNEVPFVQSEDELLQMLLKNNNVKHARELNYLVNNHYDVEKIHFVLSPFSFVLILKGKKQYHIVLETLDTEEATYVWHIDKSTFRKSLAHVFQEIEKIRNQGRQTFLKDQPENFSRIIHDYSDSRKGFILWKGYLEERIV